MNRSFAYVVHLSLTSAAAALLWAARRHPAYTRRLWPVLAAVSGLAVFSFAVWDWGRDCALVIPLALYVGQGLVVPLRMPWTAAMFLAGLLISLPVVLPRPGNPLRVELITRVLSHYVFGAIAMLAILLWALKRTGRPIDDSRPR